VAIDDPSSERALHQLEMENLHRAPPIVASLPAIAIKAFTAILNLDVTQVADLFTQFQATFEAKQSEYLLGCIVRHLKGLDEKVAMLTEQQKINWLELTLDADRKARATRAKTRVERISRILCSSIRFEPIPPADQTEEMMRIATELADDEVVVLNEVRVEQDRYEHLPATFDHTLSVPKITGMKPDLVLSICGKLQSLGLIAAPEQHAKALSLASYPSGGGFVMLDRAKTFLRFIADPPV
jgi:hypothetical protein